MARLNKKNQQVLSFIDNIVKSVPASKRAAFKANLPYIIQGLKEEGILTPNVLAYALATVQHETGQTFKPVREGYYADHPGHEGETGRFEAKKRGYSGGTNYYGRGYIQLTHDYNYRDIGRKLGLGDELLNNPDLALRPDIAGKILAKFFKDRGIAKKAELGNFVSARRGINPDDKGYKIAGYARNYLNRLPKNLSQLEATPTPMKPTPTPEEEKGLLKKFSDFFKRSAPMTTLPITVQAAESQLVPSTTGKQPKYTVQPGDTLWNLASKYLGSGTKWKEFGYQGNPRQLSVGTKLSIPQQFRVSEMRPAKPIEREISKTFSRLRKAPSVTNINQIKPAYPYKPPQKQSSFAPTPVPTPRQMPAPSRNYIQNNYSKQKTQSEISRLFNRLRQVPSITNINQIRPAYPY